MFKNLTQVYCLIICLIASVVMIITIGIMLGSTTNLVFTEYKYISELNKFSSDEKYIEYKKRSFADIKEQWQAPKAELIQEKRITEREDYIKEIKGNAISTVISCATWLITSLFFFIIHWKMYKRSASN
jgi:predicted PurR-regulated permease PerM